jgi:quinol monooxygenase YgiN
MREHAEPRQAEYAPTNVTYVITLQLKPGGAPEFLGLLTPVLDAMRHEAGFINAVLHRDPENPDRFMLYETWADHDDVVNVQMHRPYRQAYWARLPELLASPRAVQIWRPLRGDFAAPARELRGDVADRYGAGATTSPASGAAKVTSAMTGR